MSAVTCGDCRFFHRRGSYGDCRRRAPVPTATGWITVQQYDWCGEHEPRPAAPDPAPEPIPATDDKPAHQAAGVNPYGFNGW